MSTFAPVLKRLAPGTRIEAIDILRGLVIIIMALDHVRDYFHESGWAYDPLDPRVTTPLLYLTRWITNFCAPTFVLLAGVSAWLQAAKGKDTKVLSGFLVKRGLWIVALELTVISFAWSFSIPLLPFLQVMWAIGWSMVILAGLVWLPRVVVLSLGIAVITLHNLLDPIRSPSFGVFAPVWIMLHDGGPLLRNGRPAALILYPLLPWAGLMAFGYGLGAAFLSPKKDRILTCLGAGMIALFLVLRLLNGYGDPIRWSVQTDAVRSLMAFFRLQKYPPSLMFICATVGPALLTVVAFERLRGPVAGFLRTFGAVPMMAYISHLYIMHALALVVHFAAGQKTDPYFNTAYNFFVTPRIFVGTGLPLGVVWIAWAVVVALVYLVCRWWGKVKQGRRDWWLSYL